MQAFEGGRKTPDFWDRFHHLRLRRLPIESALYEEIDAIHRQARREFSARWDAFGDQRLPESTRRFYRGVFATIEKVTDGILSEPGVSPGLAGAARRCFGAGARRFTTLNELLDMDVFRNKTRNQDIMPELALRGISREQGADPEFRRNAFHCALHGPQMTEFLFLHEILVGYLVNRILNGGRLPERASLAIVPREYFALPAYASKLLASVLDCSEAELVSLHFADSRFVAARLPKNVRDLLLLSSHLYWYLELFAERGRVRTSPSVLLSYQISAHLIPSLEALKEEPGLRMRPGVAREADERFYGIIDRWGGPSSEWPNSMDIIRLLSRLVEAQWR